MKENEEEDEERDWDEKYPDKTINLQHHFYCLETDKILFLKSSFENWHINSEKTMWNKGRTKVENKNWEGTKRTENRKSEEFLED